MFLIDTGLLLSLEPCRQRDSILLCSVDAQSRKEYPSMRIPGSIIVHSDFIRLTLVPSTGRLSASATTQLLEQLATPATI
jgi:hypothetical protein